MRRLLGPVLALATGVACNEYTVNDGPPTPVADPPEALADAHGDPPDWSTCTPAWLGRYYNLEASHPDVLALSAGPDSGDVNTDDTSAANDVDMDPDAVDWWDAQRLAFQRYDLSLDVGGAWYPVDEGIEGDPDDFAVAWTAWLRIERRGNQSLVGAASTDLWVDVGNTRPLALQARDDLAPVSAPLDLAPGQYKVTARYAHRAGTPGLRLRVTGSDFQLCPPVLGGDADR